MQDPDSLYETAQQLVARGNLAGAEVMLRQAVERASDDPTMYVAGLATLLGLQGRGQESVDLLQTSLSDHPGDPHLLVAYGLTMEAGGQEEEAEHFFREAVHQDPEHAAALHNLAGVLLKKGEVDEAERMACKAFWVAPDHADFALTACAVLQATGKEDLAYEVAQLGASYNPDDMDLVQRAVEGALERDEHERALQILGESDKESPWILGWKATVLDVAGLSEQADVLLEEGREKHPEDTAFMFLDACIQRRRGQPENVRRLVDRILEIEPEHLGALKLRSGVLVDEQAVEQAIESLEKAQEIAPDSATAWELVGAYYRSGNYGKCLERCADLLPEEGEPPPLLQVYRILCMAALENARCLELLDDVPEDLIAPALDEMARCGAGTELEATVRRCLEERVQPAEPEPPPPGEPAEGTDVGPPPPPLVGALEEQYRLKEEDDDFEWAEVGEDDKAQPGQGFEWLEEHGEYEWVEVDEVPGEEDDEAEYEWVEVDEDE
ncbi:MAG: tetratricopeptide repeat protein [Armatimonadetes bacterium]|nr:tetratricopeptide repeat protein [Armatimonadota bacterium]